MFNDELVEFDFNGICFISYLIEAISLTILSKIIIQKVLLWSNNGHKITTDMS